LRRRFPTTKGAGKSKGGAESAGLDAGQDAKGFAEQFERAKATA
jgi:hypothetical protein